MYSQSTTSERQTDQKKKEKYDQYDTITNLNVQLKARKRNPRYETTIRNQKDNPLESRFHQKNNIQMMMIDFEHTNQNDWFRLGIGHQSKLEKIS